MVYQQAQMWRCRPSEVLYLTETDWLTRWSVDQAVWNFGQALEGALEEAGKNAKKDSQRKAAREKVLRRWLPGAAADTTQFRDVAKEAPDGMARRV